MSHSYVRQLTLHDGAIIADPVMGDLQADLVFSYTLFGDVTGSGVNSMATTIANGAVTLPKHANMATGSLYYRKSVGFGPPEVNSLATLAADLGLSGTNTGDQTITLTGDVTGSGTGSFAATIAANAVTYAKMQASSAANVLVGRGSSGAGTLQEITLGAGLSMAGAVLNTTNSGTVTNVTASAPLTSTGGATPDIACPVFVGSGVSHATGLVPDPGASAGTTKYLREDGSWAVPAGGIVVGDPITGGTAQSLLYEDGSNDVGELVGTTDGQFPLVYSGAWLLRTAGGYLVANSGVNTWEVRGVDGVGIGKVFGIWDAASIANGQLLIGNAGTGGLTQTTLTAGAGITITPGAGSITIAAAGGAASSRIVDSQTSTTGVGNGADTTDDTLFTYTLPAGSLATNGDSISVIAFGVVANNANLKQIRFWFAGTTMFSTGAVTSSNASWVCQMTVTRVDATHVNAAGWILVGSVLSNVNAASNQAVADLSANTSVVKVTGASTFTGAANDVLGYAMKTVLEAQ